MSIPLNHSLKKLVYCCQLRQQQGKSLIAAVHLWYFHFALAHAFADKCLKTLTYSFFIISVLLTILLCFALDNSPQTIVIQGLNHDDIQRAKQILHAPAEQKDSLKTISLNQKDLNIAASYLLDHFVENTSMIQFLDDRLLFQIAIFVPENPWGRYLDFHFCLKQLDNGIIIKSFKIGEISIPDPAANKLIPFLVHHTSLEHYWQAMSQLIKDVRITKHSIDVSYIGTISDTVKQLVSDKNKDYPNLTLYQQEINDIVTLHDPTWRLSISDLLKPLFLSALYRSTEQTAIQENRTIIIAVASYIYKNDLRQFLPIGLVYNKEYLVFAYKRIDIPQHFITSAFLTAVDSSLLSQQISIDKEVGDAQKGTGFSFIDLSADRAGTRFGQLAVASPKQARRLQEMMAQIHDYTAFLPDIADLPEHMDEQAFKEKYTNTESENYKQLLQLIDKRINALAIYQTDL